MRQRSISAVGVVIVGLVPAFMGGPAFAAVVTLLCLIGVQEYNAMASRIGNAVAPTAFLAVAAFGVAGALDRDASSLLAVSAVAVGLPLIWATFRRDLEHAFVDWTLATAGAFYLGLPLFSAIAIRQTVGGVDAGWLTDLADTAALGWESRPRGLAWLLVVILVTWLSDTGAYLVGRVAGRRLLIPRISPKKTVEGLIGGLAAAAATGAVAVAAFGLGVPWWAGLFVGAAIGAIGVIGDLAESLMKRQAGVKDSGTLIPGHGGILDRLDALLFTWPAGWFVAGLLDRWFP